MERFQHSVQNGIGGGLAKTKSIRQSTDFILSFISRHLISGILIILGICSLPHLAPSSPEIPLNVKKIIKRSLVNSKIFQALFWLQFPMRKLLAKKCLVSCCATTVWRI